MQRQQTISYAIQLQIMMKKGVSLYSHKTPGYKSARVVVKLDKINKTASNNTNSNKAFNSISSIGCDAQKMHKKISLNDQLFHRRKQNFLNSQYNRRLNALKQITKENKKIYQRINSQKSLYSQDSMRKSTTSIRSLSRSSSRVSQNNKESSRLKNSKKNGASNAPKSDAILTIQPQRVNNIKAENIVQFRSMFVRQKNTKKMNQVNSIKRQNRSFSIREEVNNKSKMGNMLHKIAEQMYQRPQRKDNQNKRKILY